MLRLQDCVLFGCRFWEMCLGPVLLRDSFDAPSNNGVGGWIGGGDEWRFWLWDFGRWGL